VSQTRVGSLESLRRLNRLRVIDALRAEGLISRAEIARRTGLSRSTVSSLVSDLQADGLVVERGEPSTAHGDQGGRPPILLSFDASAGAAVGIDFGHRHLRVAISDLASNVLAERRLELDTDHAARDGLDAATDLVAEALADAGIDRSRVVGAGMGLPGPIEQRTGIVGSAAILPGWVGVAAAEEMRRRLDLPIAVDNDANLGALAEAAFGAGRDASTAASTAARLGWPASSATCSSTPTASSAAAATAAASRRSRPLARSSSCSAARTA
jgi:DNA-binding transcriptional ArsR family regulator